MGKIARRTASAIEQHSAHDVATIVRGYIEQEYGEIQGTAQSASPMLSDGKTCRLCRQPWQPPREPGMLAPCCERKESELMRKLRNL